MVTLGNKTGTALPTRNRRADLDNPTPGSHHSAMDIRVETNSIEIARWLNKDVTAQIPFATATALNRIADLIRIGERKVMTRQLDRPTTYTLNSFQVTPARKNKLESTAGFRQWAPKGTPANKYLGPQVTGGPRSTTRFEGLLAARRIIRPGQFLVPASGADLDSSGNVKRGTFNKVLSAFGAQREQGSLSNRTGSKRSQKNAAKFQVFVGTPDGNGLGIWQRVSTAFGQGVKPIFWVRDAAPKYRKRFAFFEIAQNIHAAHYQTEFERALQEAVATTKPT